ncbi:hypothetical protein [Adhaeribacter rhizoryzae]
MNLSKENSGYLAAAVAAVGLVVAGFSLAFLTVLCGRLLPNEPLTNLPFLDFLSPLPIVFMLV